MNLNINLNLRALKNTVIVNVPGKTATKKCLAIPLEDNDLFVGEKGIYLNLSAQRNYNLCDGKTHLIIQGKKVHKNVPVLGDAKLFGNVSKAVTPEPTVVPDDDLPF
ncbi:MAG: hypothetical protein LBS36_08880 [Oscillospiraceae bacterium]|jgi:hypothetical protein|nr:hypothetical protein [Oscillospiraceae bacterium]